MILLVLTLNFVYEVEKKRAEALMIRFLALPLRHFRRRSELQPGCSGFGNSGRYQKIRCNFEVL